MPHIRPLLVLVGCLCLLATQAAICRADQAADEAAEPPFPYLFDATRLGRRQVRIVSESVDFGHGYQSHEEYVDLAAAKCAYLTTSAARQAGQSVLYLDGPAGLVYDYKPYTCGLSKISAMPTTNLSVQDWNYKLMVAGWESNQPDGGDSRSLAADGDGSPGSGQPEAVELRLMGVSGLWLFGQQRPKVFSRSKLVYSVSKDLYKQALSWRVRDEANRLQISYIFSQAAGPADLSLETIQIEELGSGPSRGPAANSSQQQPSARLLRTINVLSLDYSIDQTARDELLEAPVGYGCYLPDAGGPTEDENELDRQGGLNKQYNDLFMGSSRGSELELEITATKFSEPEQATGCGGGARPAGQQGRSSDTVSVQFAHSHLGHTGKLIYLLRKKNTQRDVKIVLNQLFNVKYTIDLRRGNCSMSHLDLREGPGGAETSAGLLQDELVHFGNGLQLDIVRNHFELFDFSSTRFQLVKRVAASRHKLEQHFYENAATSNLWLDDASQRRQAFKTRIVRTYTNTQGGGGGGNSEASLDLTSVTILVLNQEETRILESYQINLIDARFLQGWPHEPQLFDVAQECYLDSAAMRAGRDYAWLELAYPATGRVLDLVAANSLKLKQIFYENYLKLKRMDFSRVPRLELQLQDDALVLRLLLLDTPPLELVFDRTARRALRLDPEAEAAGLDSRHMAPDLAHCAQLCRLNYCTLMSYCGDPLCGGERSCLLSSRGLRADAAAAEAEVAATVDSGLEARLEPGESSACTTYSLPNFGANSSQFDLAYFHESSLQGLLARLQHQDYGLEGLPREPDELALPRSETGVTDDDYLKAMSGYLSDLLKYLAEDANRVPELTIAASLADHFFVLLPSRFTIEHDPLQDFDLLDQDELDEQDQQQDSRYQAAVAFHRGLPMARFRMRPKQQQQQQEEQQELDQDVEAMRQLNGLTYDQCSWACLDSRCGSFSYCAARRECILAAANSTGLVQARQLVEQDPDCSVYQRDYLANYVRYANVLRPQVYAKQEARAAMDASECALGCLSESSFHCLAFDYCKSPAAAAGGASGTCYFHTDRLAGQQNLRLVSQAAAAAANGTSTRAAPTGCDHYARSYLADFVRVQYRRLADGVLEQLKTSQFEGRSVFRCAEMCATELIDCSAFQFCFKSDSGGGSGGPRQSCVMIESGLPAAAAAAAGGPSEPEADLLEVRVADEQSGRLLRAGRGLDYDPDCQVFAMRPDTGEAHLRQLALGSSLTQADADRRRARLDADAQRRLGHNLGLLLLYLTISLASATLGIALCWARENRVYLRQRLERTRLLLGV